MPRKCGACGQEGHYRNNKGCPEYKSSPSPNSKSPSPRSPIIQLKVDDFDIKKIEYFDSRTNEAKLFAQRNKITYDKNFIETESGEELWFKEHEECAMNVIGFLFGDNKKICLIVAQPGVGKTNTIHAIYYYLRVTLSDEMLIHGDRISIITGMSSTDWITQTGDSLSLLMTNKIGGKNIKEEVYHQGTIRKRIKYLEANPELMSDHIFIIDECHIACKVSNNIGKYLAELGITKEIINKFHIKIILVSATPDVVLSELIQSEEKEYSIAELKAGGEYKGFEWFLKNDMLLDYEDLKNYDNCKKLATIIKLRWNTPRWHIVRAGSSKVEENIRKMCRENKWNCENHNQKDRLASKKDIDSKLEGAPLDNVHTIVIVKGFYRASKRLKITPYTGVNIEPSSKVADVTVTSQGLIPRFWGYYSEEDIKKINPLFICNKECVETYVEFTKTWKYEGIDYASRMVKKDGTPKCLTHLHDKIEHKIIERTKTKDILSVNLLNDNDMWEKFKVYNGNDDEMWNKAEEFYKENTRHKLAGKSKPKKNDVGFYKCSDTGKLGVKSKSEIDNLKNQSWYSTFQLVSRKLNYARVFVGYDDLTDNSEYTIYIKYANLEENEHNMNILQKWYKKNKDIKLMIEGQEYIIEKAPGDGNCFFHATALHLGKSQEELRKEVSKYMLEHKADFIESYEQDEHNGKTYEEFIKKIETTNEWADNLVIQAMQKLYKRTIKIYEKHESKNKQREGVSVEFRDEPIYLLYNGTNHYDALIKPS